MYRPVAVASLAVFLLTSQLAFGQTAKQSPITDVTLGRWQYDAGSQRVLVPITNNSQKTVSAFNLSVKVTEGGNVSEYESGRDFLGPQLMADRLYNAGESNIAPGRTYMEKIVVAADFQNIDVQLDMVAFTDRTAEATNMGALERLMQSRHAIAQSIEKASGQDAKTVHQLKENWKNQEHEAATEDEAQYQIIEQELQQTPPESLKEYWALKQKEKAIWLEQSQLRLVGGRS